MCACGANKQIGFLRCCEYLKTEKPPIGLRPKYIAEAARLQEIEEAMIRYLEAHKMVPGDWLVEYMELWNSINEREAGK